MGVRFLFIGTLPLCLVSGFDCALAQTASGDSEVLPAIEVVAPTTAAKPARSRGAPQSQAPRNVRRVLVYPTAPTPQARVGIDVDKVPAAINAVGAGQIARTDSLNIADALQQQVPGIIISDTTGNPFMPDIQFRGFVASPVAGTPQGLAVYQNGMRINEAFGDTVNWDLIPTAAIRSVTVVTNNPAFGLNALGGAVNVLMKDGFNYHGAEINTMGGSFGRIQGSAQYGKQIGNWSVYGALEGVRDNGYRNFGESAIRRFYGDVGYRTDSSEFHLNVGVAKNNFGASAAVPVELLQK
jgi:iron complex outermembrane receptor protein